MNDSAWHTTQITAPGSSTWCTVRGNHGAVFCINKMARGPFYLQRLRTQGIEVFSLELNIPQNVKSLLASINKDNEIVLLARINAKTLSVSMLTQYGQLQWQRTLAVTDWTSSSVFMGNNHVYFGAGFTGTLEIDNIKHTDNGIAVALMKSSGQVYWAEKTMTGVGAITGGNDTLYFIGKGDESIDVHEMGCDGVRVGTHSATMPDISSVESAVHSETGVHVAGLLEHEGMFRAFQMQYHGDFSAAQTTKVGQVVPHVELVPFGTHGALLAISIESEGSWVMINGKATHHFTDELLPGSPQMAACPTTPGCMNLLKGGSFLGELWIDKTLFEVGRADGFIGYLIHLNSIPVEQ